MSVFYVLPPRPVLGEAFAGFLQRIFPGLHWDAAMRSNLADALGEAAGGHADVYVVYREDLPPGQAVGQGLADLFGAEPGDEVVEVRPAGRGSELTASRWQLRAA
jgi:hypothetical protein